MRVTASPRLGDIAGWGRFDRFISEAIERIRPGTVVLAVSILYLLKVFLNYESYGVDSLFYSQVANSLKDGSLFRLPESNQVILFPNYALPMLIHLFEEILGTSQPVKFVTVGAAISAIVLNYRLCRGKLDREQSRWFLLLLALSTTIYWYADEIHNNVLLWLFITMFFVTVERYERDRRVVNVFWISLAVVAAIYARVLGVILLPLATVQVMRERDYRGLAYGVLFVAVLLIPFWVHLAYFFAEIPDGGGSLAMANTMYPSDLNVLHAPYPLAPGGTLGLLSASRTLSQMLYFVAVLPGKMVSHVYYPGSQLVLGGVDFKAFVDFCTDNVAVVVSLPFLIGFSRYFSKYRLLSLYVVLHTLCLLYKGRFGFGSGLDMRYFLQCSGIYVFFFVKGMKDLIPRDRLRRLVLVLLISGNLAILTYANVNVVLQAPLLRNLASARDFIVETEPDPSIKTVVAPRHVFSSHLGFVTTEPVRHSNTLGVLTWLDETETEYIVLSSASFGLSELDTELVRRALEKEDYELVFSSPKPRVMLLKRQ